MYGGQEVIYNDIIRIIPIIIIINGYTSSEREGGTAKEREQMVHDKT